MQQLVLDVYLKRPRCPRCGRLFETGRALNIHISKSHAVEDPSPMFHGEGILDVERKGGFTDIRIRMKRELWDGIEKCSKNENLTPEEAVIASLVSITTAPAWWFTGSSPSRTPVV